MKKNKKMIIKTLCLSTALCASLGVVKLLPNDYTASAESTTDYSTLVASDYTFVGYSLKFDDTCEYGDTTSKDSAFRFKMQITSTVKTLIDNSNGTITTGTLIYPAAYLNGAELTVGSDANQTAKIMDVVTTDYWKEVDGVYQNMAYLKEVPVEYYASPIAVRGYMYDGTSYYYTTATTAKSFAEVVKMELEDPAEEYNNVDTLTSIKSALNQFAVTIDEETTPVFYGEKLPISASSSVGKVFGGYTSLDGNYNWDMSTPVTGPIWLKSAEEISAQQYYSKAADTATFTVDNLAADITTATVNGVQVDCETTDGKVTLKHLNTLLTGDDALQQGGTYLIEVGGKKAGFTYVQDIKDDVISGYDESKLIFNTSNGFTIGSSYSLDGATAYTNANGGIGANVNKCGSYIVPDAQEMLVETKNEAGDKEVYKITLHAYRFALRDAEDAIEYFLGTPTIDESTGKVTSIDASGCIIKSTSTNSDYLRPAAFANDIDLTTVLDDYSGDTTASITITFNALLDGFGHTFTYQTSGAAGSIGLFQDNANKSKFGGLIRNLNVNIQVTAEMTSTGTNTLLAYYTQAGSSSTGLGKSGLDNVVFNVSGKSVYRAPMFYKCAGDSPEAITAYIKLMQYKNSAIIYQNVSMVDYVFAPSDPLKNLGLRITGVSTDDTDSTYTAAVETLEALYSNLSAGEIGDAWVTFDNFVIIHQNNKTGALFQNRLYGENNMPSTAKTGVHRESNASYVSAYGYAKGVNFYGYSDASAGNIQVGSWTIHYGDAITDITVS